VEAVPSSIAVNGYNFLGQKWQSPPLKLIYGFGGYESYFHPVNAYNYNFMINCQLQKQVESKIMIPLAIKPSLSQPT
jgi:hypothetical protein